MSDQIKIMLFLDNSLIKKEYLILLIVRFKSILRSDLNLFKPERKVNGLTLNKT